MFDLLATGLWVYGGVGCIVGLAFALYGFDRVDPAAAGAYAVRVLLLPGLVLLWPMVLVRWVQLARAGAGRLP